jgi:pimeloyl-ACP methyl ester carboxylesterase
MAQSVRYLKTPDGVRLAWAALGRGPTLVKAANWLSHLTYDLESPIWRHWIDFLSQHYRLIRYDERGSGMSDWEVGDLSPARWGEDLEAVSQNGPADAVAVASLRVRRNAASHAAILKMH